LYLHVNIYLILFRTEDLLRQDQDELTAVNFLLEQRLDLENNCNSNIIMELAGEKFTGMPHVLTAIKRLVNYSVEKLEAERSDIKASIRSSQQVIASAQNLQASAQNLQASAQNLQAEQLKHNSTGDNSLLLTIMTNSLCITLCYYN
jgi:hypothetical protein